MIMGDEGAEADGENYFYSCIALNALKVFIHFKNVNYPRIICPDTTSIGMYPTKAFSFPLLEKYYVMTRRSLLFRADSHHILKYKCT